MSSGPTCVAACSSQSFSQGGMLLRVGFPKYLKGDKVLCMVCNSRPVDFPLLIILTMLAICLMQGIWSTFCCINQSVTVDGPAWCLQSLLWHGEISQNVTVDYSACCFAESIVMWRWANTSQNMFSKWTCQCYSLYTAVKHVCCCSQLGCQFSSREGTRCGRNNVVAGGTRWIVRHEHFVVGRNHFGCQKKFHAELNRLFRQMVQHEVCVGY